MFALDIATTSTRCQQLRTSLNARRTLLLKDAFGRQPLDALHRIAALEKALDNLHRGQGLGFEVFGVVVDRSLLGTVAVKLASVFSSIVALVLALRNDSDVAAQCSQIQSMCEGMRGALAVNATCGCTQ